MESGKLKSKIWRQNILLFSQALHFIFVSGIFSLSSLHKFWNYFSSGDLPFFNKKSPYFFTRKNGFFYKHGCLFWYDNLVAFVAVKNIKINFVPFVVMVQFSKITLVIITDSHLVHFKPHVRSVRPSLCTNLMYFLTFYAKRFQFFS